MFAAVISMLCVLIMPVLNLESVLSTQSTVTYMYLPSKQTTVKLEVPVCNGLSLSTDYYNFS